MTFPSSPAEGGRFVLTAPSLRALPPPLIPEIAFWGRSNVGKSSLLNALTGRRKLARTSKTPGRTQALQFFHLPPGLMIVDMPGYGYAQVPPRLKLQWEKLVLGYLENRPCLWKVYLLIDSRHPMQPKDQQAVAFLRSSGRPFECVLTKIDLIPNPMLEETLCRLKNIFPQIWPISCKTKKGIAELLDSLQSPLAPLTKLNPTPSEEAPSSSSPLLSHE